MACVLNDAEKMVAFLHDAAKYFERRPTDGEDAAHWANVYNAENCRKSAALIELLLDAHTVNAEQDEKEAEA